MLFIFLLGSVLSRRHFFRLSGWFSRQTIASKKLIQKRKCGSLGIHIVFIRFLFLTEHADHFIAEGVQLLFGNTHLPYSGIDLGNTQASGALQAVPFVHGHTIFDLCNENNRNILFALGAHFRLHSVHSFAGEIFWSSIS